jgi:hypothetical protein
MAADLSLITNTWQALGPALAEDKCAGCECLQGALVELKLALEELPTGAAHTSLSAQVESALRRGEPHACLGCQPCNSGDILANFYREQQAHETTPAQACCDG